MDYSTDNKPVNRDLILEDGSSIKWFKKAHNNFLNKTTIIYGRTQSGKSTIIDDIMYLLKNYIAVPFVICQSSITVSSSPYFNKIPNHCIKSNVTKEWLENFINTQKGRAALYKTANDIKTIKMVFDRIKNNHSNELESKIRTNASDYIQNIQTNNRLDFAQKKEQVTAIQSIQNTHLISLYKTNIRKHKVMLERIKNLTPDEICCINYIDFNPNALIIFDDCASKFKAWVKESTSIKEMFYNGRHYYITQIITAQDDKEIDSELRKNALVSMFTTQQAATANFERKSNSYSKTEIKRAELCARRIFNSNDGSIKNYKKMVYLQNGDIDPLSYIIADIYDDFKIGCESLWLLDQKIQQSTQSSNNNNTFFTQYHTM